ncbi:MFS transporter [Morganella psychrotolerans]|uniref:Transporter n=1 Tax=Morganella psychrotolerans TaxID=368603 RepID=A0A1B8HS52_9GAMM|nr:MFS transporter [Morganella psychrotolerans]OBU12258.1 transporter [Morganella psychrotolerans]
MKKKTPDAVLTPGLICLMAIATGLLVASNYYSQPLLDTIATQFGVTAGMAGFIVTAAQLSYAAGLMFIVPLGDKFERRNLIVTLTLLSAIGLLISALSQTLWQLLLGTALAGMFSVVAQVLIPLAATLAKPQHRGKAVGIIMSGLLLGILLARTVAGVLAEFGGWRTIYWVASGLLVLLALILWFRLPQYKQVSDLKYRQLLVSIVVLFVRTPVLRVRAALGAIAFAAFGLLWTSMAFLLSSDPFNYSESTIGLFGLAGAAGALMAGQAGRFVDKGKGRQTTTAGLLLLLLSWIPIAFAGYSVAAFIAGVIILDLAVQAIHVTNQSTLYRMMPEARSRLTAGYMTCYFLGGAFGSLLSGYAYSHYGWTGVCYSGGAVSVTGLVVWLAGKKHDIAQITDTTCRQHTADNSSL